MNSPYINRFLQPDSIIPNPANPQSFNRFSYVNNRPINLNDPTGHIACERERWDDGPQCFGYTRQERLANLGITIDPEMPEEYIGEIIAAAINIGGAFATVNGGRAENAFDDVYQGVYFDWCTSECADGYGWAYDDHTIKFDGMYTDPTQATLLVVHELGHLFDRKVCAARTSNGICDDYSLFHNSARTDLSGVWNNQYCGTYLCLSRSGHSGPQVGMHWGFAGGWEQWQFGASLNPESPGEVWADMFIGWVYGRWEDSQFGVARESHMNQYMQYYLTVELP